MANGTPVNGSHVTTSIILLDGLSVKEIIAPQVLGPVAQITTGYDVSTHLNPLVIVVMEPMVSEDGGPFQSLGVYTRPGGLVIGPNGALALTAEAEHSRREGVFSQDGGQNWTTVRGIPPGQLQTLAATEGTIFSSRDWPWSNPVFKAQFSTGGPLPGGLPFSFSCTLTSR